MEEDQGRTEEETFEVEFLRAVRKDLKKLSHEAQSILPNHVESLAADPRQGEPLRGILRNLRKYEFTVKGNAYRIAYRILEEERVVLILMIGSHEGFYERLEQRAKH